MDLLFFWSIAFKLTQFFLFGNDGWLGFDFRSDLTILKLKKNEIFIAAFATSFFYCSCGRPSHLVVFRVYFLFLGGFYWVFISSFNGFPFSVDVVFVFAIFIRFVFVLIGIVFPNYLARPFFFVPLRFLWRLIIVHSFMETISSLAFSFSFFVFFHRNTDMASI